ncbi:MAG: dihydrodipicolinate synthase family protein [Trueperaceae bacterium]
MKTTDATFEDLHSSVLAVPPLARNDDYSLNLEANRKLVRYLEGGRVRTILYGGNANFYNIAPSEYASTLENLASIAGEDTWVIPSAGPSYGMFMDQADVLRDFDFPTAMVLPMTTASTSDGVEEGLRRFARRYGRRIIVYLKTEGYLSAAAVKRLVDDGLVCAIKYAVVRATPERDEYLSELCELIDRRLIVSGIGERPAVVHLREFGLRAFTSGSVCVAPRQSMDLLRALGEGDYTRAETIRERFLPLEDLRDGINPIRVIHDAVTLAGIADMGPILPLASNLLGEERELVGAAARRLADGEKATA